MIKMWATLKKLDELNFDDGFANSELIHVSEFPVDIMAGKHFMFVYINIIEYQLLSDTKAPLLKTKTLRTRLKNGCLNNTQTIQHDIV